MSDKKPIDPEGVYTISAAARLLSVSPSTLRDLERRGKIACTWTPGRQRRFGGADLLRFLAASRGGTPREPAPTPPAGASDTGDAAARRAWLGHLVGRAQRELPVDTPAAIRLRVGIDLEHALGKWGPSSSLSDLEPLITSVVERAKHQVRTAREESERREKRGELLDFGLRYLRRKLDGLSARMVGARGSFNRRHIQATLRNQLRDQLQKQLRGDEDWDHVRGLAEDFVAAWVVAHPPASRIPTTVKVAAAGVTGLVGGATACAVDTSGGRDATSGNVERGATRTARATTARRWSAGLRRLYDTNADVGNSRAWAIRWTVPSRGVAGPALDVGEGQHVDGGTVSDLFLRQAEPASEVADAVSGRMGEIHGRSLCVVSRGATGRNEETMSESRASA